MKMPAAVRASARTVVRQCRRLIGLGGRGQGGQGQERGGGYYDQAFSTDADFQCPFYQSPYYPAWSVVVERLRRYGAEKILDIGCGPGQFASLLADSGIRAYTGIDFSHVAVEMAKSQNPMYDFRVADARDPETYRCIPCDAVICMEVLEHIEDDLGVVGCFPIGVRCLMTVPNFPWRSHVRHFETAEAVVDRYSELFTDFSVTRLKGVRTRTDQFFLMDGVRRADSGSGVAVSSSSKVDR